MADARTNTLMVRTPSPARYPGAQPAQRLDRPGTAGVGGSGIHAVYLKNADAVSWPRRCARAYPGARVAAGVAPGGGTDIAAATGTRNAGNALGAGPYGQRYRASSQSTRPVAASAQPSTGGFIQADPSTNSPIITASEAQYRQLRRSSTS